MKTPFTDKLLNSNPFDFSYQNDVLFLESFKENASFHFKHHEFTHRFWNKMQFSPENIKGISDLESVPGTMVHLFKEHEFCSVSRDEIVLTLTSSGTGGQKSQQFLNSKSLENVKKLAYKVYEGLGIVSPKKYNYLCFTYDPHIANDLGTAFTDELLTSFTDKNDVYYTFQWSENKQDFFFNEEGTLKALKDFSQSPLPLRILGFPAFLYELIEKHKIKLNLGPESWLLTGGGWKGRADKEIPKLEFRELIYESLGIMPQHQRDLFGMVEHGIPYVDCERGHLHIPNYSRVFVRSPYDLSLLKKGERGLLHLLSSYNFSYPASSLLTNDYGRIGYCDCSTPGEILILEGRAGVSKHKGCAIKSLELSGEA